MSEAVSIPEGFPEAQLFTIPREGDRDLSFTGWLLSTKTQPTKCWYAITGGGREVASGIDVNIYATQGGRIVTHSHRWTEYAEILEGDGLDRATGPRQRKGTHNATWHADAAAALAWLKADAGGKLGEASKAAWIEACQQWPDLGEHECEVVDLVATHRA